MSYLGCYRGDENIISKMVYYGKPLDARGKTTIKARDRQGRTNIENGEDLPTNRNGHGFGRLKATC